MIRVIVKHPGAAPFITEIKGDYRSLRAAIDAVPGSCITHRGIRVWCDDDALRKDPVPPLNLIRPTDGAPVHGSVIVVGEDGPNTCSLDDRQVALWMATLALIGVDDASTWRAKALDELVPRIHAADATPFSQLRSVVEAQRSAE